MDVGLILKLAGVGAVALAIVLPIIVAFIFRTVVPTNEVHIVQTKKGTIPYGRGQEKGNVYYRWPHWLPFIGIETILLPVSIFDIDLHGYNGYDIGRVPFAVDVKAFFQVQDPETAAQRVEDFAEMKEQLGDILRGAVRKILASADIEEIMEGRGRFGQEFTDEVREQLVAWGVSTVKNIEFMDIRDADGSEVIHNIMAKKRSLIEKESRVEVAENNRVAQEAEIDAERSVQVRKEEAEQQVGERAAQKEQAVGIAQEKSEQSIKEEAKLTAEKDMAVLKVEQERQADIDKNVAVINAEKDKEVIAKAAEAELIKQQRNAEGIKAVGEAEAKAEELILMAPVTAQITLAQEIGENEGYQHYLLGTKGLEVGEVIGVEKAKALTEADIKVIANTGEVENGLDGVMDIVSSKGGTNLGSMLEGLIQTEAGKELFDKVLGKVANTDK